MSKRTFTLKMPAKHAPSKYGLAPSLEAKLDNPTTTPGERHKEMCDVIFQLVGNGWRDDEIAPRMRLNYGHKGEKDIANAIAGARKRNPTPTRGGYAPRSGDRHSIPRAVNAEKVERRRLAVKEGSAETLPDMDLTGAAATLAFLASVFRPEETVCITNASEELDGRVVITDKGTFWTVEKWQKEFTKKPKPRKLDGKAGAWVRINPQLPDDLSGSDAGVADFRNCLIEFDRADMPLEQQWAAIKQSGLPVSALLTSGGKSLHAWIKVEASNLEEFRRRRDFLYEYLGDLKPDQANKNPSRFSRLPGVLRGEVEQRLLALNIGAKSWLEWEQELQDHELPEEVPSASLEEFDRKNDANNLFGERWLSRGGSMIIQGQAGIGKSSFLMQMAMTWALGRPFFGIVPKRPLSAVILQAENDLGDMAEMYQDVRDGMELDDGARLSLRSQLRFFREQSRTGHEFIRVAERVILKTKADIIFADPLLAFVGGEIGKQEVASQFLRNWLNPVLESTGVLWIWLHHFGKPKMAGGKGTIKDISYQGFGSSELVNWAREVATLTRDEDDEGSDTYSLTLSKRGSRARMEDGDGKLSNTIKLQHAKGRIHWMRPTTYKASTANVNSPRAKKAIEDAEKRDAAGDKAPF